jgi:hypothetical protein
MSKQPDEQKHEPRQPGRKRAYATPTLTEYGSVAKLTQGGGSRVSDGGSTQRASNCL